MANLVQTILEALTPQVTATLARALEVSPGAVKKGLGAAAPALLAGALQKSSTPRGAEGLVSLVRRATTDGDPLKAMGAIADDPTARAHYISEGQGFATSLLGGQLSAVTNAVASAGGLGPGAAGSLLATAAPLALAALGRVAGPSLTPAELRSVLTQERPNILVALPSALDGLYVPGATAASTAGAVPTAPWLPLLPWIVGAAMLLLLLFFLRS